MKHSGNSSDLYLGTVWYESRHRYCLTVIWCPSIPPGKCRHITQIRPWQITSLPLPYIITHWPVYYSTIYFWDRISTRLTYIKRQSGTVKRKSIAGGNEIIRGHPILKFHLQETLMIHRRLGIITMKYKLWILKHKLGLVSKLCQTFVK